MNERTDKAKRDIGVLLMVVLIVALVMSYLLSRSRWLTWERGDRQSRNTLFRNTAEGRMKFTFGNIIININRSKSEV